MAKANRISVNIPADALQEALKKVNEALSLVKPYLLPGLTTDEISGMAKLGEKTEPFVEKGLEFTMSNPRFMPSWGNAAEASKDYKYFSDLRPLDILVQQFGELLSHSRIEAGAESLAEINIYYKAVRAAHEAGDAEATPIFEELNKRYAENGRRKSQTLKP